MFQFPVPVATPQGSIALRALVTNSGSRTNYYWRLYFRMKLIHAGVLLGLLTTMAAAETFSGTLMDVMCRAKDPATHTRKCAIACKKSGYGLVTADGKFLKFDEAGNAKAATALEQSSKETDLKATVDGDMEGSVLVVKSIRIN